MEIAANLSQEMRIGKAAEAVPKAFSKLSCRFVPCVLQIAEVHDQPLRRRRTSGHTFLQITAQSPRCAEYEVSLPENALCVGRLQSISERDIPVAMPTRKEP